MMVENEVSSKPSQPAPGVEVVQVAGKGRGMRATASFKPGDVIIDEEPFAAVAMADIMASEPVCHGEFTVVPEEDLKTCVACKHARYSSKAAQKADWARGHKYECKALRSPQAKPLSMLRLMARVLWKRGAMMKASSERAASAAAASAAAAGKASLDDTMQSNSTAGEGNAGEGAEGFWESYEAIAAMQANPGALGAMPRPALLQMLGSLRYYLSQTKAPHGSDEALHEKLMLQLMSNSFAIAEAGHGMSHGLGVYPIGAVFNHSSRPNCGQSFCKGRLQIRAVRPISPGDDLEISYTTMDEPTFLQRSKLQSRYCFDLRPELPRDNKFKGAHTEELGGCVRTTVLDAAASGAVLLDAVDAAHCAVLSDPAAVAASRVSCSKDGLAPGATRFCSVDVKADDDFGGMGLGPLGVPGEDQLESNITLVTAKHILREAWLPDVPDATWLEQLRKERWSVHVMMFGQWEVEAEAQWRGPAYAAVFAVATRAWSESLRERGESGVARRLLLKADCCGREVGLADSHMAMRPVLQGLVDIFLHAPIRSLKGDQKENFETAKRFEHAVTPEGHGDLGFDLDKVGEATGRCGEGGRRYAAQLWREAADALRLSFGEARKVMLIVFKAEYFKDNSFRRRGELIKRFGPYLPREFMHACEL